jgi:hypothetical protein
VEVIGITATVYPSNSGSHWQGGGVGGDVGMSRDCSNCHHIKKRQAMDSAKHPTMYRIDYNQKEWRCPICQ